MFAPYERLIAMRYLRARKQEGFVSVIAGFSFMGIMLGVATLIVVMAVMNGFRQDLITRILGLNGHMNMHGPSGIVRQYEGTAGLLMTIESVKQAIPTVEGQALMTAGEQATGVIVRGMSQEDFQNKPILSESLIAGDIKAFKDHSVIIGSALARRYGLRIGDDLTLIAPKGKVSPFGTIPRSRSYKIGGVFFVDMYEYDSNFVFMPLQAAQRFYQMADDAVSTLEIYTEHPERLDSVKEDIMSALGEGSYLTDWKQRNGSFFNALQVERNVMFLILTLIIVVAAFNIISSMIMLVKDKGHDIAIMRTMGATRGAMMRIFMLTGASIGLIGTCAGALLGISFAKNIATIQGWIEGMTGFELFAAEIYFLSHLPSKIDVNEVMAVLVMAFSLSILATIYPAWRAARMDPVEALRYE